MTRDGTEYEYPDQAGYPDGMGTLHEGTDDAAAAMAAYVQANPKGKHGAHRYDLADFGLHDGEVIERFGAYADRYGVAAARA